MCSSSYPSPQVPRTQAPHSSRVVGSALAARRVQPGLQCPWTLQCSCWMALGRVPLRPGHIPSWNSLISLPGMKVNTPAKSFLDKTYLPRARGSSCPCQGCEWGEAAACDTAVTGAAAAATTPSSSPGIDSLWNPVHSFSLCAPPSTASAASGAASFGWEMPIPFLSAVWKTVHKEFPMKGSVSEHWHHRATHKTVCGITRGPRVLAAVQRD